MHNGIFITFEGIEGSGKTTQIYRLNEYFQKKGLKTVLTREPGGTPIGDQIRSVLLKSDNKKISSECELFLYAASREQHVHQVIQPALNNNMIVLCDRFVDATTAYQGYGRGLSLVKIQQLNKMVVGSLSPQLTILLDGEPEILLERARKRLTAEAAEKSEGRFEEEEMAFHQRVRNGYLALARAEPERIAVINAEQGQDEIHHQIIKRVESLIANQR